MGVIRKANGSALVEIGDTKVFVAVYGTWLCVMMVSYGPKPAAVYAGKEFTDVGQLTCDIRLSPFCRRTRIKTGGRVCMHMMVVIMSQNPEEQEIGQLVLSSISNCVLIENYPKSVVELCVEVCMDVVVVVIQQVLEDDGSMLSCIINACVLALADARIEMTDMPCACELSVYQGQVFIDADKDEEAHVDGTVFTTMYIRPTSSCLSSLRSVGRVSEQELSRVCDSRC